jgi:hypothetical protein
MFIAAAVSFPYRLFHSSLSVVVVVVVVVDD